ncbi:unnamed protein product [Calypogeia fissa]
MAWFCVVIIFFVTLITILGALRHAGWIEIHPEQIQNENCRKAFEAVVDAGTVISNKLSETYRTLNRRQAAE